MGRLIFDILVESKLEEMNLHEDIYMKVGNSFNEKNLKNMLMNSEAVDHVVLDREYISTKRVKIDDFPIFNKLDPGCFDGIHEKLLGGRY